jgi:acetate kinase
MAAMTATIPVAGRVLVVNVGSSSLKLRLLDPADAVTARADLPAPRDTADDSAIKSASESLGPVDAIGHRIVHGGTLYTGPVQVDEQIRQRLESLTDLAPLHQPKSLAALDAVQAVLPAVPAVACFDTAFHATIPAAAATFALPEEWRARWSLRRYGFHGLSHSYVSRRAAELLGRDDGDLRLVTCHLGAGASLAATRGGRSVDTTMGFTPLDGLVMATRSGSVDPGLVLWLEEHAHMPPAELAREVYLHRLRASVASMVAAMDGLDAIVFTGGVGENSAEIRQRAMDGLGFLGIAADPASNDSGTGDREIGAPAAAVRALVISAREDIEIARQVRATLARAT